MRNVPPQPTINVNFNLNFPPGIQVQAIPQEIQSAIQQLLQQGAQAIRDQVVAEIGRQSPVVGVQSRLLGAKWTLIV
jgi:hypothetical protein